MKLLPMSQVHNPKTVTYVPGPYPPSSKEGEIPGITSQYPPSIKGDFVSALEVLQTN